MRGTWVMRGGELVEKGGPLDVRPAIARSHLPRPMIRSDSLGNVVNPLDGKPYDSKSAYYKTVKNAGCEILGDEKITPRDNDERSAAPIEAAVAKAYETLS